jgi:hypothetical protein
VLVALAVTFFILKPLVDAGYGGALGVLIFGVLIVEAISCKKRDMTRSRPYVGKRNVSGPFFNSAYSQ